MKKVVVALVVAFLAMNTTIAGENPKLVNEITRKLKIDLSKIKLNKESNDYVIVKFRVIDQVVHVLKVSGSKEELSDLMVCELEEMFINAEADPQTTYQYKFTFERE